ncbi:MAG: 50S ribosomal protein L13 [Anaplasmataceae bacterium]|nr:50S ribosomal protein L13 [Candidatus Heimdallarchaeota archaeon]MDH5796763.1 50S ribosomal protein L13 [Anaplasmataceae bacterium]
MKANKSFALKPADVKKKWYIIDASAMKIGRLAVQIAKVLSGKHKPNYTPNVDCGDNVVVINGDQVVFSGKKMKYKIYYKHTGYPGGIRKTTPIELKRKGHFTRVLIKAVKGMISKGPLGYQKMRNLRVYPDAIHSQMAQKPIEWNILGAQPIKERKNQ